MNYLKALAAAAAVTVIVIAFRDQDRRRWLAPVMAGGGSAPGDDLDAEPVLGYDGMDVDTLRDWLDDADLDRGTLLRMREYEESHLAREGVLVAIDDRLG
jgi:hypothetical protein